jgi:hypothetical protein
MIAHHVGRVCVYKEAAMSKQQEVDAAELSKLSFLKGIPIDGRVILTTSYYLENKPFLGFPNPRTGEIIIMPNTTPIWGAYWGVRPVFPDHDAHFSLLDLLAKHYSFPKIVSIVRSIELDLGNMAAVLEKFLAISDYHSYRREADTAVRLMYLTELEYFFGVCRSLIDLLHECYAALHQKYGGRQLPPTFGKFADGDIEQLSNKYRLPPRFQAYLNTVLPPFRQIRKVRDDIYHNGKSLDMIYLAEEGPGICTLYEPFSEFHELLAAEQNYAGSMLVNSIGSLYYLVTKLVDVMLSAMDQLATVIAEVLPGTSSYTMDSYNYYCRGPSFPLFNHRSQMMRASWLESAKTIIRPYLDSRPALSKPPSQADSDSADGSKQEP